ncbi:MAG: hypothetical protein HY874_11610 [Chloroflexi bacterium]|nr:hypothetical protein [Chloroflexota bacterium]
MNEDLPRTWSQPTTVAELHLPPTFVADHCIRTLSYQGPMTPTEIARHWHIHDAVVTEIIEVLKATGLVQIDSRQATLERHGRVRLTDLGQARVAAARERTWYAGPLPVSLADLRGRAGDMPAPDGMREVVRAELGALAIEASAADEIGQALVAGATLAISGVAADEQHELARALGWALIGEVTLPYAMFAAGAVVRMFDARYHRPTTSRSSAGDADDILRSHSDGGRQWATVARPAVTLTGGVLPSDVLPAYDDEAKFYLAPVPLAASGGLLCVADCGVNLPALADLARLWLIPGHDGAGIMLLRSGERIEVPWRAATVLFGVTPDMLPMASRHAATYGVDIAALAGGALAEFVARRLPAPTFPDGTPAIVAGLLERSGLGQRGAAAQTCRYLRDRARYEGAEFALTPEALQQAVAFAGAAAVASDDQRPRAVA